VPRHQSFAFAAQFLPGHAAGPSGISANSKKCVARQSTIAHPRSAKLARRRTRTPLHKMLCALRAPELIWRLARRGRRRDVRVGRCSAEGAAGLASARRAIRLICVGWIPQGPVFVVVSRQPLHAQRADWASTTHATVAAACTSRPAQVRTLIMVGSRYSVVGAARVQVARQQLPRSRRGTDHPYEQGRISSFIRSSRSEELLGSKLPRAEWQRRATRASPQAGWLGRP
jgi:hypothetical protein